jgi:hypothetical protein
MSPLKAFTVLTGRTGISRVTILLELAQLHGVPHFIVSQLGVLFKLFKIVGRVALRA